MCRKPREKAPDKKQYTGSDNNPRVAEISWSETEGKQINGNISNLSSLLSCNHILSVNSLAPESKRWTKKYIIGEEKVTFNLDTGTDVNCISLKVVRKLGVKVYDEYCELPAFDYNDNKLQVFGTCKLKLMDLGRKFFELAEFVINDVMINVRDAN